MPNSEKGIELLEEILLLLRLQLWPKIRMDLEKTFTTNDDIIAFQNSDGQSTREIAETCGYGKDKINSLWKEWYLKGLGDMIETKGGGSRFVRRISLSNFGFEIKS
ncbi:MAG: hypothetical protein P1Q69_03250 [Candidatus Thorarchaeota archaeon]|nr:hypothetical protein [Candidatus Thorarchaeota archaeon]